MRLFVILLFVMGTLTGVAQAQTSTGGLGYAEAVAQSAFGNATSQSYGGEVGVNVAPNLQVFAEVGQTRNVAAPDLASDAETIAAFLRANGTGAVAYTAKQPVFFVAAGVKYLVPLTPIAHFYVQGGGGIARVKRDVAFTIAGSDVTANLEQHGVTLGSDLSGDQTKPMITAGGGVMITVWRQLIFDLQYRYGRIFTDEEQISGVGGTRETRSGINVHRVGAGIGVRF